MVLKKPACACKMQFFKSGKNGPGWIRTNVGSRQRVYNPSPENPNDNGNKDLSQAETGAYKPAYKDNPKMAENQDNSISLDLAEIVQVWPGVPETAIKASAGLRGEQKS